MLGAMFGVTISTQLCGESRRIQVIERKDADGIRTLKLAHGKVSAIDIELGEAFVEGDEGARWTRR